VTIKRGERTNERIAGGSTRIPRADWIEGSKSKWRSGLAKSAASSHLV